MAKKRKTIPDAELAVMEVLWKTGPMTAKEITRALYPNCRESEYAAVHSFLQQLEKKQTHSRLEEWESTFG